MCMFSPDVICSLFSVGNCTTKCTSANGSRSSTSGKGVMNLTRLTERFCAICEPRQVVYVRQLRPRNRREEQKEQQHLSCWVLLDPRALLTVCTMLVLELGTECYGLSLRARLEYAHFD